MCVLRFFFLERLCASGTREALFLCASALVIVITRSMRTWLETVYRKLMYNAETRDMLIILEHLLEGDEAKLRI